MKLIIGQPKEELNVTKEVIVINDKTNKEGINFASIMVSASTPVMTNGFLNIQKRVAFINGLLPALEQLVDMFKLEVGSDYSEVIPSKIVVEESFTPYWEGQAPKINPETGQIITSDGKEVYRNSYVTSINDETVDTLLKSDKVEVEVTKEEEIPQTVMGE